MESCEECRFWKEEKGRDAGDEMGDCRRHSPIYDPSDFVSVWPSTCPDQWCGDFDALPRATGKPPRQNVDPVGLFLADCVEELPGGRIYARDLYDAFAAWAEETALAPMTETAFGREMACHRTYQRVDGRRRYFQNCGLKTAPREGARGSRED